MEDFDRRLHQALQDLRKHYDEQSIIPYEEFFMTLAVAHCGDDEEFSFYVCHSGIILPVM